MERKLIVNLQDRDDKSSSGQNMVNALTWLYECEYRILGAWILQHIAINFEHVNVS